MGFFSPETFLLGVQRATFSLCSHRTFSLYGGVLGVPSFSSRDTSPFGKVASLVTSFSLNYLFRDLVCP